MYKRAGRRGFSVIELLVVALILSIVVALALVGLGHGRASGRAVVCLSNLRQHAQTFAMYGEAWDEALPHFAKTDRYVTRVEFEEMGATIELRYFGQFSKWSWFLASEWYGGQFAHESFWDPSGERRSPFTDYFYPCTFVADSGFWRDTSRTGDLSQWRSTRRHEIVWPQHKVLLVRPADAGEQKAFFALVDGSAGSGDKREAFGKGYPRGDGQHPGSWHWTDMWQYLHTLDGVRGRDL